MNQHLLNTLLVLGGMITGATIAWVSVALRGQLTNQVDQELARKQGYDTGLTDGLQMGFKNSEDGHTKNGYMAATTDVMDALAKYPFDSREVLAQLTARRNERRAKNIWGTKPVKGYHA